MKKIFLIFLIIIIIFSIFWIIFSLQNPLPENVIFIKWQFQTVKMLSLSFSALLIITASSSLIHYLKVIWEIRKYKGKEKEVATKENVDSKDSENK